MKTEKQSEDERYESAQMRRILGLTGGCNLHPYNMLLRDGTCPSCSHEEAIHVANRLAEFTLAKQIAAQQFSDDTLRPKRKCKECDRPFSPKHSGHVYCADHNGGTTEQKKAYRLRDFVKKGFEWGRLTVDSAAMGWDAEGRNERVHCKCVCGRKKWVSVKVFERYRRLSNPSYGCASKKCKREWIQSLADIDVTPEQIATERDSKLPQHHLAGIKRGL